MGARDLKLEDINVGDSASFSHTITEEDILDFARLSGDYNPLHLDKEYASHIRFGRCIVHGMFLGALSSRLIGMYIPGKHSLYLSQSLQFKNPAYVGNTVVVTGIVTAKSESTKIVDVEITMKSEDLILVSGLAKVQVL